MSSFENLPGELILLILHHLDKQDQRTCSLVNRTLYSETYHVVWEHLNIGSDDTFNDIMTTMATSAYSPGTHVRFVKMAPKLCDAQFLAFIKYLPLLTNLELDDTRLISEYYFLQLEQYCPHLTHLKLMKTVSITQESIESLVENCYQLDTVSWRKHCSTCEPDDIVVTCDFDVLHIGHLAYRRRRHDSQHNKYYITHVLSTSTTATSTSSISKTRLPTTKMVPNPTRLSRLRLR